ncbi:MAG: pyruvate synthase subunit PorB [Dehalococcoidia bacterium]
MNQEVIKFGKRDVITDELFAPGHRGCIGCGEALAVRLVMKAVGKDVVVSNATGCIEIISSPLPTTSWRVPWIHTLFENTAAVASGVEAGLKIQMKKGKIPEKKIYSLAFAGDGATSDIGIQALSGALERGHNFVYVCFDNEAYMNTGIQRSSATPYGASTTTAPAGKASIGQITWKKDMPAIAAAHNIPYVATASPSYPFDLMEKVKKAAEVDGPAYVHILSVCPTGWRIPTDQTIAMGKLAVQTGVFPLYEVENGKYKLNVDKELKPVSEYLKKQGRFRHLSDEEIEKIQQRVTEDYAGLKAKAEY